MKNPAVVLSTCCLILLSSCKLEEKEGVFIDKQLDLYYVSRGGQDLLDTAVAGSYNTDSIHMYEFRDGIKHEVVNRIDYPKGFLYLKNDLTGKYLIRIFPETEVSILELNASTFDTIRCTLEITDRKFIITSVLYNGLYHWDDMATPRALIVTK